jgi:hypothetical protein
MADKKHPVWKFQELPAGGGIIAHVNEISFKFVGKPEIFEKWGNEFLKARTIYVALQNAMDSFRRGQWADYGKAIEKLGVIYDQVNSMAVDTQRLTALFDGFFEPKSISAQFTDFSMLMQQFVMQSMYRYGRVEELKDA